MVLTIANATLPQCLIKTLTERDVILILCTVNELFHLKLARSSTTGLLQLTTVWIIRLLLCVILLDRCLLIIPAHPSCNSCSHSVTLHTIHNDQVHKYLKHAISKLRKKDRIQ